jgi:periplasmic divalent cation tolerance protein
MTDGLIIFSTCGSEEEAKRLAQVLVEEKLAGCVNVIRGIESIYRWEDKVESAAECLLVIKTEAGRFDALSARLQDLHSYEVPEVVAFPIVRGAEKYLGWLKEQVRIEEGAKNRKPVDTRR